MGGQWTQFIVAPYDGHGGGREHRLAERHSELDAPRLCDDVLCEKARTRVFLDPKQTEEGEDTGAPVACVLKQRDVDVCADGEEVLDREGFGRLAEVAVAVPVAEASPDAVECTMTRQRRMALCEGVMADR